MLSRRIWTGLVAGTGLGLLLAGVTIGGWWFFDARYQPVRVGAAGNIEAALKETPSIELHSGQRPVYIIGPRGNDGWQHWAVTEARKLATQGREVRAVVVPSGYGSAAEEVTVAQLWLNPELRLLNQWLEQDADLWTGAGMPSLRSEPLRQEALASASAFARLTGRETGTTDRWPLVFWHDPAGDLVVCVCDTPQAQDRARKTLGLTGQAETVVSRADRVESAPAGDVKTISMPYPQGHALLETTALSIEALNEPAGEVYSPAVPSPSPRLPGDVVPAAPQSARAAPFAVRPSATTSRPHAKAVNTAPPEAKKEAESLFF